MSPVGVQCGSKSGKDVYHKSYHAKDMLARTGVIEIDSYKTSETAYCKTNILYGILATFLCLPFRSSYFEFYFCIN